MKYDYDKLIEFYEHLNSVKSMEDKSVYIETSILRTWTKIQLWQNLSDEEKQRKRWQEVKWLKYKIYPNVYHLFVEYEESVVQFYDKVSYFIKSIEVKFNNIDNYYLLPQCDIYLLRLVNLLRIEKGLIDTPPEIKSVNHLPEENIIFLFEKLKERECPSESNLNELLISYKSMINLYNRKPYSNE